MFYKRFMRRGEVSSVMKMFNENEKKHHNKICIGIE